MRELVYYVAVSLDGYIAAPDDTFADFPMQGDHIDMILREYTDTVPTLGLRATGLTPDLNRFDTVLMGWNTYKAGGIHPPEGPYGQLKQYVFSRNHSGVEAAVTLTGEDPAAMVRKLKREKGSGIWLAGGGMLASAVAGEIDRLILKVNPILLGSGKRLFAERGYSPTRSHLVASTPFESGVVVNEYTVDR
ncbi:dihydrofolate reductase family protein [Rhodococcoides yunnanense]|uniref:Dihydrofolate reductase family protein n=1 Tax=Rhodococcoides yunnanense TaxID=278209 RepID=A0ABU4BDR2_9NOCA|nr:dihydrofolate reductase family protein [Rhodococcus yunnanensis]MDV6262348.1 dihydrofolate reductase family protein [Rhodococcus yunnanensis]